MGGAFFGGLLFALVVLLGVAIWSIRRHLDPDGKAGAATLGGGPASSSGTRNTLRTAPSSMS